MALSKDNKVLAVIKCLSRAPLSLEEAADLIELGLRDLMIEHELDHIQAQRVYKWTHHEALRLVHQEQFSRSTLHERKKAKKRRLSMKKFKSLVLSEVRKLREQDEGPSPDNNTHHWPRVDWSNVGELVDKWADGEEKAFDKGDPSMMGMGDTATDAKKNWELQVDQASMEMEAEMTDRIRQVALQTMKEFTDKLINGEFS
jgi:hypothetical protein